MHKLVAVALNGETFVDTLRRVWDRGDAVLPIDPLLPTAARARLIEAMSASAVIDDEGERAIAGGAPVEEDDALVVATSGSTGEPKGAVHTHASVEASATATSTGLGVDVSSDRWLCCLPLSHVAGLSVVTRALRFDVPLRVLPRFDAAEVEDAARTWGATLTTVVPTALSRFDHALFRRIVVGGAAPPTELPRNCVVSYGMTETGSAVTYDGRALQAVELRVVHGEIHVRGPMLLRSYRDGRDPKNADGWFATRDAGELSEDGRLTVLGRADDVIISGGLNIWPVAVERVLSEHPDIAEVTIIGRADDEWGQRVVAVIVPRTPSAPPTLDEIRSFVKERMHPHAAPRELDLVTSLPRTSIGKVQRHTLT